MKTTLSMVTLLSLFLAADQGVSQTSGDVTLTIYMTAVELKGATTVDKLAPPAVNPKDLSQGYEFKATGEVDERDPKKWQVSSICFRQAL